MIEDHTHPSIQGSTRESIKELAKELAMNYCDNSLSNPGLEVYKEIMQGNVIDDYKPRRIVLIVGAGASKSVYPDNMLTGPAVIDQMRESLKVDSLLENQDLLNKKFKEYEERFRLVYQLEDHKDFESSLALLSNYYTSDVIRGELKKYFNHRYKPSLLYEIIAHMFKHRFIDVIINFNFDEMLDQAIEEEMLGGDYHYIYSDGHCRPIEELTTDGRIKVPIYIKPHGTISHLSTLRFTKDDYFSLPYDIKNTMYQILSGHVSQDIDDQNNATRTTVLCLGYAMKSLEFNDILYRAIGELERRNPDIRRSNEIKNKEKIDDIWRKPTEDLLKIFYFDLDRTTPPSAGKSFREQRIDRCGYGKMKDAKYNIVNNLETRDAIIAKLNKVDSSGKYLESDPKQHWLARGAFCKQPTDRLKKSDNLFTSLSDYFDCLWCETVQLFQKTDESKLINNVSYAPRGISRHYIICDIFHVKDERAGVYRHPTVKWKQDDEDENLCRYAEDRTIVELIIALAKTKGRIDISQLTRERVGIYYEIYRRETLKANKSLKSLFEICKNALGLDIPHSLSNAHGLPVDVFSLGVNKFGDYDELTEKLFSLLSASLSGLKKQYPFGNTDAEDAIKKYLQDIASSFSSDLRPKFRGRRLIAFRTFRTSSILHTNLSLKYKLVDATRRDKWDIILTVSERGTSLLRLESLLKDKTVPYLYPIYAYSGNYTMSNKDRERLNNIEKIIKDELGIEACKNIDSYHNPVIYNKQMPLEEDNNNKSNDGKPLYLPYWLHHHHMTIFLERLEKEMAGDEQQFVASYSGTGWKVKAALYYQKESLSTLINPIWLQLSDDKLLPSTDEEADFMMMLEMFYLYRVMAVKKLDNIMFNQVNEVIHNDYCPRYQMVNAVDKNNDPIMKNGKNVEITSLRADTIAWLRNLWNVYEKK